MRLTDVDVAAVGRWSTNTVAHVASEARPPAAVVPRRRENYIRYRAGNLKTYVTAVLRQKRARSMAPQSRRNQPAMT
jgi:hypothetical protein